jgi:hypothetical protein
MGSINDGCPCSEIGLLKLPDTYSQFTAALTVQFLQINVPSDSSRDWKEPVAYGLAIVLSILL